MRFITNLILAAALFAVMACSSSTQPPAPLAPVQPLNALDGHTYAESQVDSNDGTFQFKLAFSGLNVTRTGDILVDASDPSQGLSAQIVNTGSYVLGADNGDGTNNIDLTYATVSLMVNDAGLLNFLNSANSGAGACNVQWTAGQAQDITNCADLNSSTDLSAHQEFQLIQIGASSIQLGDTNTGDATSAANRPTAIDTTDSYQLQ